MWIELYDGAAKAPVGPLMEVTEWAYGDAVSAIGTFQFSYPASDPKSAAITKGRYARLYIADEGYVSQGRIEKVTASATPNGERLIVASGRSAAVELVALKTKGATFDETDTIANAVASLTSGTSWAAGILGTPSLGTYSRGFFGVSKFEALNKLAELFGWLTRFDSRSRTFDLANLAESSGLRFEGFEGPVPQMLANNPKLVPLASIALTEDVAEVVTRVIPFGQEQGISGDRVTLELATVTSPYTVQTAIGDDGESYWYLADAAAESVYGVVEEYVTFRDITPASTSSADRIRAANALHGAASTYLSRRVAPFRSLIVQPVLLRHIRDGVDTFKVGQSVRVKFDGWVKDRSGRREWLAVDEDLYLMGYHRRSSGDKDTWQFQVSSTARRVPDSTQALVEMYQSFQASLTAPRPMFTWGGVPPVGRLTPQGAELVVPEDSGIIGAQERSFTWYDDEDFSAVRGRLFAAYNALLNTSYFIHALKPATDGQYRWGFYDTAAHAWDYYMVLNQLTGGDSQFWGLVDDAGQGILGLFPGSGANDYVLKVLKSGVLTEVGGMLKAANNGPYLWPDTGQGNNVRSGSANAWGSWYGISRSAGVSPGAPATDSNGATSTPSVTMPGTVAAGDMLVAVGAANTTSAYGAAPSGWSKDFDQASADGRLGVFKKIADGTEGGTNVTFNIGAGVGSAWHIYRILAANHRGVMNVSTVATGNSNAASATAVNTGGHGAVIHAAVFGTLAGATFTSGGGYGNGSSTNDSGSAVMIASDYTTVNNATEDPDNLVVNAARNWAAVAIGIPGNNTTQEALYITAGSVEFSGTPEYVNVQLATGAPGAESIIGTFTMSAEGQIAFPAIIPVATATQLSARTMTNAAAADHKVKLTMLNQDDAA